MAFIPESDQQLLRQMFADQLQQDITLKLFTRREPSLIIPGAPEPDMGLLRQTRQLMEEVTALSPKIRLDVLDVVGDAEAFRSYRIDRDLLPAVLVEAEATALRFIGVPAGSEFSTFIQDILDLSQGSVKLSEETQEYLRGLEKDVHLQVFVTPTCPYCPQAAWMAHQMMMVNPQRVTADVVEANEFPEYSQRYDVSAVPRIVINDTVFFEGALPEQAFVEYLKHALAAEQE